MRRRCSAGPGELASAYLDGLAERPVRAAGVPSGFGGALPAAGEDPVVVLEALAAAAEPGLVASAGPRYFGFVDGRLAARGARRRLAVLDLGPERVPARDVAGGRRRGGDRLRLGARAPRAPARDLRGPRHRRADGQPTALAAGRHAVLARAGWDVEARGLQGAPWLRVLAGEEAHVTVFNALRLLGIGHDTVQLVPADGEGRMRAGALAEALDGSDLPTIVCAQAGNVNTGAFDPLAEIVAACRAHGAWVHVDGAFGLWAAAAPGRAHLTAGASGADSWAVDAHKWLNVPYDGAFAFVADPEAHRAAMRLTAAYLAPAGSGQRDGGRLGAGGVAAGARLPDLGRAALPGARRRGRARRALLRARGAHRGPAGRRAGRAGPQRGGAQPGARARARSTTPRRRRRSGACRRTARAGWAGPGAEGRAAMRISVSNWSTTEEDADRSAEAIAAAVRAG